MLTFLFSAINLVLHSIPDLTIEQHHQLFSARGCLDWNSLIVSSLNGSRPPRMLLVNSLIAPLMLPLCIKSRNFRELLARSRLDKPDEILCWVVSASRRSWINSPFFHCCSLLSSVWRCSLLFDVFEGFWRRRAGIICIAVKAQRWSGVFSTKAFNNLVISFMKSFPAFLFRSRKRLLFHDTIRS